MANDSFEFCVCKFRKAYRFVVFKISLNSVRVLLRPVLYKQKVPLLEIDRTCPNRTGTKSQRLAQPRNCLHLRFGLDFAKRGPFRYPSPWRKGRGALGIWSNRDSLPEKKSAAPTKLAWHLCRGNRNYMATRSTMLCRKQMVPRLLETSHVIMSGRPGDAGTHPGSSRAKDRQHYRSHYRSFSG